MSKFQNKSEIDINTVDPDLLKLAKQLASKMKTGKETGFPWWPTLELAVCLGR